MQQTFEVRNLDRFPEDIPRMLRVLKLELPDSPGRQEKFNKSNQRARITPLYPIVRDEILAMLTGLRKSLIRS